MTCDRRLAGSNISQMYCFTVSGLREHTTLKQIYLYSYMYLSLAHLVEPILASHDRHLLSQITLIVTLLAIRLSFGFGFELGFDAQACQWLAAGLLMVCNKYFQEKSRKCFQMPSKLAF